MNAETIDEYMRTSPLVYFKPTKNFFDFFLKPEWKWRRFHDCGAGLGTLTKAMRAKGLDCVAYDLHPRDEPVVEVKRFDTAKIADEMQWSEVALIARPCHHPDFIDRTVHSALEVGEAFYISKPERVGEDLLQFQYDVLARDVGESGEALVRVRCDIDKHYLYRKIKNPELQDREEWWWYSPARKRYTSEPTGLSGFGDPNDQMQVLEEVHLANDLQAMEAKAKACVEESLMGWIAPDGEWFGCKYGGHDYIARVVLGCSVPRLEQLGFIRCYGEVNQGSHWIKGSRGKPTPKQRRTLKAKGYNP